MRPSRPHLHEILNEIVCQTKTQGQKQLELEIGAKLERDASATHTNIHARTHTYNQFSYSQPNSNNTKNNITLEFSVCVRVRACLRIDFRHEHTQTNATKTIVDTDNSRKTSRNVYEQLSNLVNNRVHVNNGAMHFRWYIAARIRVVNGINGFARDSIKWQIKLECVRCTRTMCLLVQCA